MGDDYELKPSKPAEKPGDSLPADPVAAALVPVPPMPSETHAAEPLDDSAVGNNRAMAILAYIPILVIIPLVFGQQSRFVRYHTNQGFLLFILEVLRWAAMQVLLTGLPYIFNLTPIAALFGFINGIISALFLVLAVVGILHVMTGSCEELPIFGKYRVIEIDPQH